VLPAVKVAHDGFPVTEDLVRYMKSAIAGIDNFLVNDPTWAIDFAPNGTLLTLNDTITRKRYAKTLKKIAFQGPDIFYEGPMAEATIAALTKANGTMTLEDLKNYTVAIRKPAQIDYRGYKLTSTSAPSSGGVALSIMKIVEGFEDFNDAKNVNLSTHRLDEAIRWGYGEVQYRLLYPHCRRILYSQRARR
jgi:gamma-glutamyltranspeptidase/glutathione hydrolase